jgi:two-component system chemotaxis sensor kinase CheA
VLSLLSRPGFTTVEHVTALSGRGLGLSVVQESVRRLHGDIALESRPGGGTRVLLSVPLSVSTHPLLLVECRGAAFGIPIGSVERLCRVPSREIETREGRPVIRVQERSVPLVLLAELLGFEGGSLPSQAPAPVAVLKAGERRVGIVVDALLDQRSVIVKELGIPRGGASIVSGAFAWGDGRLGIVLNAAGLVERAGGRSQTPLFAQPPARPPAQRSILVVDDSITTRSLERSILEAYGYTVQVAVDGLQALERMRAQPPDLVITDVLMPRLDGFGLIERMKQDTGLARIPVIVVSSCDQREERQRGLSLGADAYIVKQKFDQRELLETIRQIL